MKLTERLRSVFLSVMANKFRVFLTSLGIIIGSFTIIMVVGIGKASSDAVSEQYKRLSVETITIARGRQAMTIGGGGVISASKSVTKDQLLAMANELEHVKSVGISTSTNSPIVFGTLSEDISVQGINEAYAEITHLDIKCGEFFTDDDGARRSKVAVLGENVAKFLFGEEDYEYCIGESVRIKGQTFTVVGVLKRIGGTGGVAGGASMAASGSADDMAFIPYDVALKYTSGSQGMGGGMSIAARVIGGGTASYVALASDINSVDLAIKEIQEYIFDIMGDYTSYTVSDAGSSLASALETSNTMSGLLMAVAAIVLIVSGIGIMNVLLVAVKERTREIGILKAIGAPRGVILTEFLLEAVFISVIGGIMGASLSYYAPNVLANWAIDYAPSFNGLLLGVGFAVVTGVFFGYYPAYKASKLKPIDALNAE